MRVSSKKSKGTYVVKRNKDAEKNRLKAYGELLKQVNMQAKERVGKTNE